MKTEEWANVTVRISKADADRLERLAKKARRTKSAVARNFLLAGMDDAKLLDAIGLWKLMANLEDKYTPDVTCYPGNKMESQTA